MASKDFANTRFSGLKEITAENVGSLKPAWTFSTGVLRGHEGAPLVVARQAIAPVAASSAVTRPRIYGRYGRAAYGASALFVFVTMVHTGALGALFAFSTSPYYPLYLERASATGIDPVNDQQLAGLYMWIPSGIVLTVFALALMLAWLSESDRRARATS